MIKIFLFVALILFGPLTASVQNPFERELQDAKEIAKLAGERILEIRASGALFSQDVVLANGKVVRQTRADIEASQIITEALAKRYPLYGIISQDQIGVDPSWYTRDFIWLVNPIDGTKNFEANEPDFHVQLGLLKDHDAVLGVAYYPATNTYIWAVQKQGAWIEKEGKLEQLIARPSQSKVLIQSSSFAKIQPHFMDLDVFDAYLSSTTRVLKIIRDEASLYISLGALEKDKKGGVWNYGANEVIAKEAGLILKTLKGDALNLREPQGLLVEGVVLTNNPDFFDAVTQIDWEK